MPGRWPRKPTAAAACHDETFQDAKGHHSPIGRWKYCLPPRRFLIRGRAGDWKCARVVLCAGLGNRELAPQVACLHHFAQPWTSARGRTGSPPSLNYLGTGHVHQTGEGTLQIGDSKEDVGFDSGTTTKVMAKIAHRAIRLFPLLRNVKLVRAWGALRVMTQDGYPIYQSSTAYPGAHLVTCHSGVTLTAFHEGPLADSIASGLYDSSFEVFHAERFTL